MHETPRAKAGDDLTVRLRLFDENGQSVNLTGVQSVVWRLAKGSSARPGAPAVVTRELNDGVTVTAAQGDEITALTAMAQTSRSGAPTPTRPGSSMPRAGSSRHSTTRSRDSTT